MRAVGFREALALLRAEREPDLAGRDLHVLHEVGPRRHKVGEDDELLLLPVHRACQSIAPLLRPPLRGMASSWVEAGRERGGAVGFDFDFGFGFGFGGAAIWRTRCLAGSDFDRAHGSNSIQKR